MALPIASSGCRWSASAALASDVGGVSGYAEFVEAISDPGHEEHTSVLEWIGGPFDPELLDVIAANDRLPRPRAARRRET